MKFLAFLMVLASFSIMAAETTTECPMMREQLRRTNPKANMDSSKSKEKKSNSAVSQ
jgi:hypothetical protein